MTLPKLRFKEFSGDWCKLKVSEVTEYLVDGTHFSPKSTEGEFKYITSKNIRNDGLDLTNISYISRDDHESIYKRCKVKFGDILLTKDGANTGNCCLNTLDEEFSLLSSVAVLRGEKEKFDNRFILQILQSDLGQNAILSSMAGQAISRITLTKLKNYSFQFPSIQEQTKIASFLSAVDEKISQLNQKHRLLCEYKQGMMQKLFSQQLRFKADDGGEFAEWGKIQLKDVAERVTRKNKEDNQNALTISAQMGLVNQQDYFSKQIASRDLSKYYLLHKGEFAYNKSYSAGYPMGAIKRLKLYEKGVVSTLYICFALNDQLNAEFFEHYVESGALVSELEKIAQEGARNHGLLNISLQEFFEVSFVKPCLEEQIKIANFLSAIDQKIEVVAQQIEQAKTWKKGLLQQMFV